MSRDPRPVALVTNTVPDYRRDPFRLLGEAEGIDLIAWQDSGQRAAVERLARGSHRAVIAGLGGRLALPASYAIARRSRIPFILWASLWEHPTTLVHRLSERPAGALYRRADAVVTYGPHVTRYVAAKRGGSGSVFEAPQSVDVDHFARPVTTSERDEARGRAGASPDHPLVLFVGRLEHEKGVDLLARAFERAGVDATLAFAGSGPLESRLPTTLGPIGRDRLPALYAAADMLVLPSVRTATFTEPWGLVVNEAMLQGTPVITSDAVGAAAGGLVRHEGNGLIVPQADTGALATAIRRLSEDAGLRHRLGDAARADAATYTPQAWVAGMRAALRSVGAGREEHG
jgi:glycosyltransferase involved in cell wall biosynthesis